MRLETESSLLVYIGPAQSMPGDLWTLVHPDGEDTRTFLFDSAFEAQIFAQHFRAELSLSMPAVLDPRRAMDYANIMDKLNIPQSRMSAVDDREGFKRPAFKDLDLLGTSVAPAFTALGTVPAWGAK